MRGAIFQWFCIELQRILLRRGHGKDLVQLSSIQTMGQEGELTDGGGFTQVVWEHTLIYREGRGAQYMGESTKLDYRIC